MFSYWGEIKLRIKIKDFNISSIQYKHRLFKFIYCNFGEHFLKTFVLWILSKRINQFTHIRTHTHTHVPYTKFCLNITKELNIYKWGKKFCVFWILAMRTISFRRRQLNNFIRSEGKFFNSLEGLKYALHFFIFLIQVVNVMLYQPFFWFSSEN